MCSHSGPQSLLDTAHPIHSALYIMEPPWLGVSDARQLRSRASIMTSDNHLDENCTFCKILLANRHDERVFEDELTFAFLDHRPLFAGHCLLIPKTHLETIGDLPDALIAAIFSNARLLAGAVQQAMGRRDIHRGE